MAALLDDSVPTDRLEQLTLQSSGPVTSTFATSLCGRHTDLVVTRFSDKTLVVVTQVGKLGTVLDIAKDAVDTPGTAGTRPVYSVSVLLGRDTEEVLLLGRMLAEKLASDKPLLVCVGIKDLTPAVAAQVVKYVASKF